MELIIPLIWVILHLPLVGDNFVNMAQNSNSQTWSALKIAMDFGWMIVVPLVLFALAGRYADNAFGTTPWLLLAGMGLAITTTTVMMVKKFSALMRDVNQPPKPK